MGRDWKTTNLNWWVYQIFWTINSKMLKMIGIGIFIYLYIPKKYQIRCIWGWLLRGHSQKYHHFPRNDSLATPIYFPAPWIRCFQAFVAPMPFDVWGLVGIGGLRCQLVGGWVEPTHLKPMIVKTHSSSPNRGENNKYLSCHHLGKLRWLSNLIFFQMRVAHSLKTNSSPLKNRS